MPGSSRETVSRMADDVSVNMLREIKPDGEPARIGIRIVIG